jgi:TolB-like protein
VEPGGHSETLDAGGGAAEAPSRLTEGTVVGDRYRITSFLAAGGMGEVYRADDLELREAVALKRIRPDVARGGASVERFKREILLARKVTHRNVCRIFEFGAHDEQVFLTMELLPGETLLERIRARERLPAEEAEAILTQIAAGLDAAHAAGIIHRDLKSANIMLDGERAVITDFGMARLHAPGSGEDLSAVGTIVGTPAYMAPEQLESAPLTPAADIYALGVVMYEMVTGEKPWKTIGVRLNEEPPSPRKLVPELDPRWEAAIHRCLRRDPAARFASAGDVVRALRGPARRRRGWPLGAMAAATLATGGLWLAMRPLHAGPAARHTIAALPLHNVAGRADAAWLGIAIPEMLRTELDGADLRSLPGESVARMRAELALPDADSYAPDTLARIATDIAADYVVVGSYVSMGTDLRVDVRLQDTRSGELVAEMSETGTAQDLFPLVARAGAELRGRLHATGTPASGGGSLPADPEAARLYAEGLGRMQAFDPKGALDPLQRATALEPDFPLAHSALAQVFGELRDEPQAEAESRRAFDLSGRLAREERLLVEARYRDRAHDVERAIALYRSLFEFYPDNLEYGLALVAAQTAAGHVADAHASLERLRVLPGVADDPRFELAEDNLPASHPAHLALEQSAERKARARGAKLLAASALIREVWTQADLGYPDRAEAAIDEARAIYRDAHDRLGEVLVANALGVIRAIRGDRVGARDTFDEAAALALAAGARHTRADALGNAAYASIELDDLAVARERLGQLRALDVELADRAKLVYLLRLDGWLAREAGDLDAAERLEQKSAALDPDPVFPFTRELIASVKGERGELAAALGELEALASDYSRNNAPADVAEIRVQEADLELDLGRAADAEAHARSALPELSHADVPAVGRAWAVIALALAAQGKDAEARQAVGEALRTVRFLRDKVSAANAALAIVGGDEARARVKALLDEAERAGVPRLVFQARLALARDAHDRRELDAIAAEARKRGFGRIADQAAMP